jgi:hypothetical protein
MSKRTVAVSWNEIKMYVIQYAKLADEKIKQKIASLETKYLYESHCESECSKLTSGGFYSGKSVWRSFLPSCA